MAMLKPPDERRKLSLQTQMEMARGALGKAVDPDRAKKYMIELQQLMDGELELQKLCNTGCSVHCSRARIEPSKPGDDRPGVIVSVTSEGNNAPMIFAERWEGFPSNELIAKVMLVAG